VAESVVSPTQQKENLPAWLLVFNVGLGCNLTRSFVRIVAQKTRLPRRQRLFRRPRLHLLPVAPLVALPPDRLRWRQAVARIVVRRLPTMRRFVRCVVRMWAARLLLRQLPAV
jgi:hypothetical protein